MSDYTLFETKYFSASQAKSYRVLGYVIVESKEPIQHVTDFNTDQSIDLIKCLARAETLVQKIIQPERIYIMKFGEENPQVHFHIVPRTRVILDAYLKHVGNEKPFSGARIVDWIWQNHECLGITDDQIREFVLRARGSL